MTASARSFHSFRSFVSLHSVRFVIFHSYGNVILPHFLRRVGRVLYRWLYSLWKSVMYVPLPHFSRCVLYVCVSCSL